MLDDYSDIKSTSSPPFYHHATALELKHYFDKKSWRWEEYFKFISIRNPWDMLVSLYHYSKPDLNGLYFWHENTKKRTYQPGKLMEFTDWIERNDFYFWRLERFILDEKGHSLVDLIIKVEELEKGLNHFFDHVHLPRVNVPHINTTRHRNYKGYYTTSTEMKIEKLFKFEIEMGEYKF
jgi:hypothetical protein